MSSNIFYDDYKCQDRLIEEYNKYKKLIVGFDFDNTIFDVHNRGIDVHNIINLLKECKELGFILCLYTLELRKEWLDWKIKYCEHFGIKPNYVNDSPVLQGAKKPFFNILLDDRAGLESAYNNLKNIVKYVKDNVLEN